MAKYTIKMSCGHEDTIELLGKNRERKIAYYEKHGLCKECYKNKMQEQAELEGFAFNATVLPYINDDNGSILLSVWFSGNTKQYKDDIKSLGGYKWSERKSANDFYSTNRPTMCWNKIIELDDLSEEIIKATSIGADSVVSDDGLFAMAHYQIALNAQKEWEKNRKEILSIQKPIAPSFLNGCKWNQRIYGKSGNYSIYLDGEKIFVTDEQVEEIKNYLNEKEEYNKKVKEIKNK